jgi:hypothetical protein
MKKYSCNWDRTLDTKTTELLQENSLRIDRGKCMGSRLRFPYNQRCSRKCMYK